MGALSNENCIYWLSWEKLGVAKSRGEMGFRDLIGKVMLVALDIARQFDDADF